DGKAKFFSAVGMSWVAWSYYNYQVMELAENGSVKGSPMTAPAPGPSLGADGVPTGVGLAFVSLRSNSELDAVLFYLMRPNEGKGTECIGEYFIGWNIDLATFAPSGGWSDALEISGDDTWFG